jgi:hypothetical protein
VTQLWHQQYTNAVQQGVYPTRESLAVHFTSLFPKALTEAEHMVFSGHFRSQQQQQQQQRMQR